VNGFFCLSSHSIRAITKVVVWRTHSTALSILIGLAVGCVDTETGTPSGLVPGPTFHMLHQPCGPRWAVMSTASQTNKTYLEIIGPRAVTGSLETWRSSSLGALRL